MTSGVTFLLCIENNAVREQALLLCESIRVFGGRHRDAPIVAVAARAGLGVDLACQRRLAAMRVEYVEKPLNVVAPDYGSANRVVAAAWLEPRARSEWIVVLDSDTLVFDELELPSDADIALRPVDTKGSGTTGSDDPFEAYWNGLAALQGVALDDLPYLDTTDGTARIRAAYNGGLVVVRRELGLLRTWADLFTRSIERGLRPWLGSGLDVRASTGMAGVEASEYWGSNQAALSIATWSRTRRVHVYSDRYNVPLHMLVKDSESPAWPKNGAPVHVHYHWLLGSSSAAAALDVVARLGVTAERLAWLEARTPIGI
jgi:hypothetical protein